MTSRGLPLVHLHPGRAVWGREDVAVSTVLGSCVALTLHCPDCGLWVMTHAQMPGPGPLEIPRHQHPHDPQWHFTDSSVRAALALCNPAHLSRLEVKVFGGAQLALGDNCLGVGPQNVRMVLAALEELGLRPQAQDLGGPAGRKLLLLPRSGQVFLKRLGNGRQTRRQP